MGIDILDKFGQRIFKKLKSAGGKTMGNGGVCVGSAFLHDFCTKFGSHSSLESPEMCQRISRKCPILK